MYEQSGVLQGSDRNESHGTYIILDEIESHVTEYEVGGVIVVLSVTIHLCFSLNGLRYCWNKLFRNQISNTLQFYSNTLLNCGLMILYLP